MPSILTVTFGGGDVADQLFALKISALRNHDAPAMWRLTDDLMELLLSMKPRATEDRWPRGYISESRLFNVPVDYVAGMPHLLCEDYVIYPYTVRPPKILLQ